MRNPPVFIGLASTNSNSDLLYINAEKIVYMKNINHLVNGKSEITLDTGVTYQLRNTVEEIKLKINEAYK